MWGTALQRISEAEKSQGRAVKRTAQQWNSLEKQRIAMEEHGLDKQSIKQNIKIGGIRDERIKSQINIFRGSSGNSKCGKKYS